MLILSSHKNFSKLGSLLRQKNIPRLIIKRRISTTGAAAPAPAPDASFGARLRYLRRRLGLTIVHFAAASGVTHNSVGRLERDEMNCRPRVLVRILTYLAARHKDAFPEIPEPYDCLVPPTDFGAWLKNRRLRRGFKSRDLAKALGVRPFTIVRYEADRGKPEPAIRGKLRKIMKINGDFTRGYGFPALAQAIKGKM